MHIKDQYLIARYANNLVSIKDIINFAHDKLNNGIYSKNLIAILDAEYHSMSELEPYFRAVLDELGYEIPTFKESINFFLNYHLNNIANLKADPITEFELLLNNIDNFDLHHDIQKFVGDNLGIHNLYGLYYSLDDVDHKAQLDKIKALMINESKAWLINSTATP